MAENNGLEVEMVRLDNNKELAPFSLQQKKHIKNSAKLV